MQKRFSEEQIVEILREAEKGERSIGELCRAHGIAQNTFYRWRHHYGGMQLPEVKRLKELDQRAGEGKCPLEAALSRALLGD